LFINLNVKEIKILARRLTIACGWWSRSWRLAMSQRHRDGKNNGNNGSKNSKWNVWNSHFPLSLPSLLLPKNPLSLKKKKKRLRKREREREETENIGKIRNQYAKNGAECRGTWEWYLYWEHEYRDCPHFYRIQHALWPSILYAIFFIEIPCNSKLLCFIKEAKEKVKQAVYMPFCCWCIWNLQSYFCVPTTTWEIIFNLVSIFSIKGMMMSDINVTN